LKSGDRNLRRHPDWIYFKLYLGEAGDRCDSFLIELVAEFLELSGIERWFYLRYIDDQGFHLRLRFQTDLRQFPDVSERVWEVCDKALRKLPALPPSDYFPMVPPPGDVVDFPPSKGIRIEINHYEPELDKFGGKRGMPIAEELFETSSKIAVSVLRNEARGELSRKTIAPCFMQAVADAFTHSNAEFWKNYSLYWLGSNSPASHDFREHFFAKGRSLRADGIPILSPPDTLPAHVGVLLKDWDSHLHMAASSYKRAGVFGQVSPEVLAFNFAHLMNNRLGLYSLEEAYLAALLEQRTVEPSLL